MDLSTVHSSLALSKPSTRTILRFFLLILPSVLPLQICPRKRCIGCELGDASSNEINSTNDLGKKLYESLADPSVALVHPVYVQVFVSLSRSDPCLIAPMLISLLSHRNLLISELNKLNAGWIKGSLSSIPQRKNLLYEILTNTSDKSSWNVRCVIFRRRVSFKRSTFFSFVQRSRRDMRGT